MTYTKIFLLALLTIHLSVFAQVEEPIRSEKNAKTSNVKPSKSTLTTGSKALKAPKPQQSSGKRTTKSNQTK